MSASPVVVEPGAETRDAQGLAASPGEETRDFVAAIKRKFGLVMKARCTVDVDGVDKVTRHSTAMWRDISQRMRAAGRTSSDSSDSGNPTCEYRVVVKLTYATVAIYVKDGGDLVKELIKALRMHAVWEWWSPRKEKQYLVQLYGSSKKIWDAESVSTEQPELCSHFPVSIDPKANCAVCDAPLVGYDTSDGCAVCSGCVVLSGLHVSPLDALTKKEQSRAVQAWKDTHMTPSAASVDATPKKQRAARQDGKETPNKQAKQAKTSSPSQSPRDILSTMTTTTASDAVTMSVSLAHMRKFDADTAASAHSPVMPPPPPPLRSSIDASACSDKTSVKFCPVCGKGQFELHDWKCIEVIMGGGAK